MSREPVWDGYFADPFLLDTGDGYVAYGSSEPFTDSGSRVTALVSADLVTWHSAGTVLQVDAALGTDVWAPEVVHTDGRYWMYYSVGTGIHGHHLRVATSDGPLGPFVDAGVDLTPHETFAIDPHPFRDVDGTWYLFFARDVLDADRPGTHLAVARMRSMTELEPEVWPVLEPDADWQLYERDRSMYGRRLDWHTLEGPSVTRRGGRYWLFYSGGSWEGPGYGVSYATADQPFGPWRHAPTQGPAVLSSASTGLRGPGHSSLLPLPDGSTRISFHAWDSVGTRRQMYIEPLVWGPDGPSVSP
ncbi:glycoside hydrolase family 43 protein [Luteipulveratus flavus]|uniref:Glycoside hydrolase family 43 protein n=1 Tax=Luteipulveratus flavus TaxID=3031728 RepID=A0ABT6C2V0_9MICO|nr:glycoside hydrolase family 43 protein [Luteipulveratus sp. YIM 133296]MDF8262956.1 glycoside hydrolase family 43 protein [Luteipulveratus sp. YIM 133296]